MFLNQFFPNFLANLISALEPNKKAYIKSGFKKCGIIPLNPDKVLSMIPYNGTPDSLIDDSIHVNDSVLNILKELRFESPPENRTKRTRLNVEPSKSVGVSTSSESENEVDSPDIIVNKNENSTENQINIDTPEVPEMYTVSSNIKTIQINNIIKVIENVYNIEKSDIKIGDWLQVNYHTNICNVIKFRDIEFEGKFLKKKSSLSRCMYSR